MNKEELQSSGARLLPCQQMNQMVMTPTSASRSSVMKSFIKHNTPQLMDPSTENEQQHLENLWWKEEAEQLRKQKVEEDKWHWQLEEVKQKEHLHQVPQAQEQVEQMKEEKKKQTEQKFVQLDEKAKEERLAEEKAKKKSVAKKMEDMEVHRKQEEETWKLRWLQQEQEEW